jgi:hypothetical protein
MDEKKEMDQEFMPVLSIGSRLVSVKHDVNSCVDLDGNA